MSVGAVTGVALLRGGAARLGTMSAQRPLLLLDVDGVLNPFAAEICPDGFREHSLFPDEGPVRLNHVHGPWLVGLAEKYEIVWATGWEDDAHRVLSPILGLPQFPVIRFPPVPFHPREKVPAIAALVRDRAAAWVDDALTPEAYEWAGDREAPTLLIGIDPCTGLTRPTVDRLSEWQAELDGTAR